MEDNMTILIVKPLPLSILPLDTNIRTKNLFSNRPILSLLSPLYVTDHYITGNIIISEYIVLNYHSV